MEIKAYDMTVGAGGAFMEEAGATGDYIAIDDLTDLLESREGMMALYAFLDDREAALRGQQRLSVLAVK